MQVDMPSARQLRRIRRVLLRQLPKVVADAFAMESAPELTRGDRDRAAALVDRVLQTSVGAAERLECTSTMAPRERAAAVMGLVDELVAVFSPPWVPRRNRGMGFFVHQIRALRKRPLSSDLRGTGYRRYQRGIRKLVAQLFNRGLLGPAYDVWSEISQAQGVVQFQPLLRLGGDPARSRRLRRILTRQSHATMEDLQSLTETFRVLAGMYERHLRALAALAELGQGRSINSTKVQELPLARIMAIVGRHPDLAPIARRFDRRLRNAVAHDDIAVAPRLEKITVRDRGLTRTVGPQRLAKDVRETAALVTALMGIPLAIFERTIFAANVLRKR